MNMTALPPLRDFDDPDFNPFFAESAMFGDHLDPYPLLAQLRSRGPVVEGDYREFVGLHGDLTMPAVPNYMLTTYEACSKALLSPEVFTNNAYSFNLGASFGKSVSTMDGEEHGRYRRIFQKVFLPQHVREWGSTVVDPVVDDLLEGFVHTGKADLVSQFTLHYPFGVIYRQLDLPPEQGKVFHKLAIAQTLISILPDVGREASNKLGEFFPRLIDQRRANPGDDLVSLLVQAEVDGEYLPEEVLVSFFRQLVNAAGDTTYRGTSVLLTQLLRHPDQLAALREDRSLLPNAIEEALRFDGPVIDQARWVATDTELLGVPLKGGSIAHVLAGSANRDPAMFDAPDEFDIRRPNAKRHLAFSVGPHICIGQHLARVEMTRAVNAILDRLPNLRADPDAPPPQLHGAMMRVPHSLPVVFDPA
jgi:cytochrome P450